MTITLRPSGINTVTKSGFNVTDKSTKDEGAIFFCFLSGMEAANFTNSFVSEVLGGENDAMREALVESVAAYLSERDLAARDEAE